MYSKVRPRACKICHYKEVCHRRLFSQPTGCSSLPSVISADEPSRSTTRNIWSTPAPRRTSTWSKTCCHDDHLHSLLHSLCMFIEFATRGCCQRGLLFIVKYSSVSLWNWHLHFYSMLGIWLISFISLSLSLCLFSIISMGRLPVSLIFFYDIKPRRWALVYLKVSLLKWKQHTYYCCFTFQCMASRVTAHRHTKKYTYPSEWQAAQQSVREWCRTTRLLFNEL